MEKEIKQTFANNNFEYMNPNSIYDYNQTQQNLISELFSKLLFNIVPLEFKLFSNKNIRLKEFSETDSLNELMSKIRDNHEM